MEFYQLPKGQFINLAQMVNYKFAPDDHTIYIHMVDNQCFTLPFDDDGKKFLRYMSRVAFNDGRLFGHADQIEPMKADFKRTTNVAKYRKKPVVIEALKFQAEFGIARVANWLSQQGANITGWTFHDGEITIPTLEGEMKAKDGDFIIRGVKGEFYPCKPDIFAATYEAVSDKVQPTETTLPATWLCTACHRRNPIHMAECVCSKSR